MENSAKYCAAAALLLLVGILVAQAPSPQAPDPAVIERGRASYAARCASCHGEDTRGSARGVDLVRAYAMRLDPNGKRLAPFLASGHDGKAVPPIDVTAAEAAGIAAFVHSVAVTATSGRGNVAPDIVVGDAAAGEAYFNGAGKCNTCHSVTGDLRGIGSKYSANVLQNRIVLPRGRGPAGRGDPPDVEGRTVTITQPSGEVLTGKLVSISDFLVTFRDSSGRILTVTRKGDVPRVEVHDILQAHIDNMRRMTTTQMHDLTAYLVNQK